MPRTEEQIVSDLTRKQRWRAARNLALLIGIPLALVAGIGWAGVEGARWGYARLVAPAAPMAAQQAPAPDQAQPPAELAPTTPPRLASPRVVRCDGRGYLARPTYRPCARAPLAGL